MNYQNEFLESFEGKRYRFRNLISKNSILISYNVSKYQTKRSKGLKENREFQNFLLSELKSINRRCFRGKVAIEFYFNINQRNSPSIHSLLKHYIDLIQKPQQGVVTGRKYLLIKDDSQIKALSANYLKSKKNEEQTLTIRLRPFRDFLFNLEFASDLYYGKYADKKTYLSKDDNWGEERWSDLNDYDSDDLVLIPGLKLIIDGKEIDYDKFQKQVRQEEKAQHFLKRSSYSSVDSILSLIKEKKPDEENNSMLYKTLKKVQRVSTLVGPYNIDFGSVPVSQGDSKIFRESIYTKIKKWKDVNGKFLPNNPALALKFYYEKPNKVNHDLDNLLKYVLPHFNELINKDRYFKDVTSIEIYQIETIFKNRNSGNLYLKIEDFTNENMFQITERLLENYE
jgi:Holliday junction resolvase RusA-like endonuclease